MPRYSYKCNACKEILEIFHLADEAVTDCSACGALGQMKKQLTTFTTNPTQQVSTKAGKLTEEFIQDAHRDLKQQKKELEKSR